MAGVGIRFRETMAGWFALGVQDTSQGAAAGEDSDQRLAIHCAIEIDDLDAFIADPDHQGRLSGTVDYPALGEKMPSNDGVFKLFSPTDDPAMKHMVYELRFTRAGQSYYLAGHKEVRDDPGFDLWSDTTTLYTTLHEGTDKQAPVVGAGVLRLGVGDLKDLLSTLEVTGAENAAERAKGYATFGKMFLGELWDTYAEHAS